MHSSTGKAPLYTKQTRQTFVVSDRKRPLPPIRDLVVTRTDTVYKTKPEGDRFHDNYHRRLDNGGRGHFSLDCQPYKIMGGDSLLLDPREIILQIFRSKLAPKYYAKLKDLFDIENKNYQFVRKSISEELQNEEPLAPLSNIFPKSVLWSFIKESEKLMWSIKSSGMQFYEELIQKLLDDKYTEIVQEDQKNAMVLQSLSSTADMQPGSICSKDPDLTPTTETIMESELLKLPEMGSQLSLGAATDALSTFSSSSMGTRKLRRKQDHLKMLKYIFRTLDILCNIPNKLLRSKVPLTRETVNSLTTENKNAKTGQTRIMSIDAREPRPLQPSPTQLLRHVGKGTASSFGTPINTQRTSSPRNRNTPRATMTVPGFTNVETWDDLVNLHEKQQKKLTHDTSGGMDAKSGMFLDERGSEKNMSTKTDTAITRKHQGGGSSGKTVLWQALMNEKLSPVESSSDEKRWSEKRNKKGKMSNETDAAMRLRKLAKNFRSTGDVLDQELLFVLQKLERKKISSFRFKFATLEHLRTLDFYEKHRLYVKKLDLGVDPAENAETEQCNWMQRLIRDTNKVSRKDLQLSDMLTKLSRFSYVDTTTPIYGRAKICLLLMSLPANELLEIYAQKALKFIIEHVLLCSKGVFKRWMEHRQIPSVIEANEEASSPLP